jgi:ribosomal-protein-alanine N-acetyltransferase
MGKTAAITISAVRPVDLDQVLAIEQASFGMPWSRALFMGELRNPAVSTTLGAFDESAVPRAVFGYCIFHVVSDEMHILNLAVRPSHRRQGVARRLVLAALRYAFAKGARVAYLEVRASNDAAQRLYASLGFAGLSLRRDYYDMPMEDAVVMMLAEGSFKTLVARNSPLP